MTGQHHIDQPLHAGRQVTGSLGYGQIQGHEERTGIRFTADRDPPADREVPGIGQQGPAWFASKVTRRNNVEAPSGIARDAQPI